MRGKYNIFDLDTGRKLTSLIVEIPPLHESNPCNLDMCNIALDAYYCTLGTVTADLPRQRLGAVFMEYAETPLNLVKHWLRLEADTEDGAIRIRPILHNDGLIILQMLGWSINLKADGTWTYEGTEGG